MRRRAARAVDAIERAKAQGGMRTDLRNKQHGAATLCLHGGAKSERASLLGTNRLMRESSG